MKDPLFLPSQSPYREFLPRDEPVIGLLFASAGDFSTRKGTSPLSSLGLNRDQLAHAQQNVRGCGQLK
jgi:hypothetical protein